MLLGIDLGTSSVKVSVVDPHTNAVLGAASWPQSESPILSPRPGWAEQDPEQWWKDTLTATGLALKKAGVSPQTVTAIGIAYQMHGLVLLDKDGAVLRPAIIWCDSRATAYGERAAEILGAPYCRQCLLNPPGNFTASKLAWVKEQEPQLYSRVHTVLLPGDYIAYRFTGTVTTSSSALSEGILWDFSTETPSRRLMEAFGFDERFFPGVQPVFSDHGKVSGAVVELLGFRSCVTVSYKAGDQPNNAFSLGLLRPGEVGATAGTSGVVYAISDTASGDPEGRYNAFAHVNHSAEARRIGLLLCINGVGAAYRWLRDTTGHPSYNELNRRAEEVPPGCEGMMHFPFGNGSERMLGNRYTGAWTEGIDFNRHGAAHLSRAVQEGIACAFRYGLDAMRAGGTPIDVVRAGEANLFLSPLFARTFASLCGVPVELHPTDGSRGAALGAGAGSGLFASPEEAIGGSRPLRVIRPESLVPEEHYLQWREALERKMKTLNA